MVKPLYRLALPSDEEGVRTLAACCGKHEVEQPGFSEMWKWMCFGSRESFGLIVEVEGEIVGSISVRTLRYVIQNQQYLISTSGQLMVHPDRRSTFIYSNLIKRMFDQLKTRKIDSLITYAKKEPVSRSNQALGLRKIDSMPIYVNFPIVEIVLLLASMFSIRRLQSVSYRCFMDLAERLVDKELIRKDYASRYDSVINNRDYKFYKIDQSLIIFRVLRIERLSGAKVLVLVDQIGCRLKNTTLRLIMAFVALRNYCLVSVSLYGLDSFFAIKLKGYDVLAKEFSGMNCSEILRDSRKLTFFENDYV